jgi:predicted ATP-dependent protease
MTAMAELVAKAERRTGNRASAVQLTNQWVGQIIESSGYMSKAEAAAYILSELERRRRARVTPNHV